MKDDLLLDVRDLRVSFFLRRSTIRAVDSVSFGIRRGEVFGLAGESGCGKSVTAMSIIGLFDRTARVVGGQVLFEDEDLLTVPIGRLRKLRGDRVAMIFQDPMTSLNPVFSVGHQIAEAIVAHRKVPWRVANREARDLLEQVGIDNPDKRVGTYPHQLSGGMRQRVMIAMAVALRPALLIADEPTTALDVTVQHQILQLLKELCGKHGMAVLLITHNLAVVAENCDRVGVMYAGQLVELGDTEAIFRQPLHPYTCALLRSMPSGHVSEGRLASIAGMPPIMMRELEGCRFAPRCESAREHCWQNQQRFQELEPGHWVRCSVASDLRVGASVPA